MTGTLPFGSGLPGNAKYEPKGACKRAYCRIYCLVKNEITQLKPLKETKYPCYINILMKSIDRITKSLTRHYYFIARNKLLKSHRTFSIETHLV